MLTAENYIDTLLTRVPGLKPVYEEHLSFYGKQLNHILFGELFDFAVEAYEQGDIKQLQQVVDFINEAAQSTDEYLLNPVDVSFMEYIPHSPLAEVVKPLLNDSAATVIGA